MLCDSKSDDPTPLVPAPGSEEVDRLQGKRPWAKYRKVSDWVTGDKVKVPEGRVDLYYLEMSWEYADDTPPKTYSQLICSDPPG